MTTIGAAQRTEPTGHFHRALGTIDATALVAGSMIGSGIFIVSAQMTRELGSAAWLLAVWALAGTMTVVAAALYGDLVARFPRAGGQYVYLREAFGPLVGFLYGWTLFLVIQTGTIAAVAVAFARFTAVLIPSMDGADIVPGLSAERVLAIALIAVLTAANCRGIEVGKAIQNVFTTAKIAALVAVIALCAVAGSPHVLASNLAQPRTPVGGLSLVGAIGSAMVGALFSADAWNNLTFAAEEVRDPVRTVPRALIAGTVLVILVYLATNLAYLLVLPALGTPDGTDPVVRGIAFASHDRVATAVMQHLLGPVGVVAMASAIMVSTFGCVNGLILSGARVTYAMARDDLFFTAAGRLSPSGAPAFALVVQGVWAALLTLSGTYGDLLDYVIFAALLFYALTVAATLRYGHKAAAVRRVLAIGYVVVAGAVMLDLLLVKPRFTWPGLLIVVSGAPVYAWWMRYRRDPRG